MLFLSLPRMDGGSPRDGFPGHASPARGGETHGPAPSVRTPERRHDATRRDALSVAGRGGVEKAALWARGRLHSGPQPVNTGMLEGVHVKCYPRAGPSTALQSARAPASTPPWRGTLARPSWRSDMEHSGSESGDLAPQGPAGAAVSEGPYRDAATGAGLWVHSRSRTAPVSRGLQEPLPRDREAGRRPGQNGHST